jgi:hypothetical protein
MYTYIVTSTTSVKIQAPSVGAAAKLVQERPGHVGVVSARMAIAEARTIPISQYLGNVIEDEVEDHPLHDMAWLGDWRTPRDLLGHLKGSSDDNRCE